MSRTFNIFISHSWAYSSDYDRLVQILNNRLYFSYNNHSVPKYDPIHTNGTDRDLKIAITNKMSNCHCVLLLAGKYSTHSKWIGKEIDIAKNSFLRAKPIIGIKPWASTQVSSVVRINANVLVNWNTESIIQAIRDYSI